MIDCKFYNFDSSEINSELESFYRSMCDKYFEPEPLNRRIKKEALRANVLAILNERTYTMFNPIADNWEEQMIEIIFGGMLDGTWDMSIVDDNTDRPIYDIPHIADKYDIINYVINSKEFKNLQASIKTLLDSAIQQHHPSFTIWEVNVEDNILYVDAKGDYRIEQWHHEHGVVKPTDVITVSLDEFRSFVSKEIGYRNMPLIVCDEFETKSECLDSLIQNFVSWLICDSDAAYKSLVHILDKFFETDKTNHIIERVETYFRLDYSKSIERISNQCPIAHFYIYGSSMAIHLSPQGSGRTYDWKKMQQERHEQNMDYIPVRER